jgi:hypothetical protein
MEVHVRGTMKWVLAGMMLTSTIALSARQREGGLRHGRKRRFGRCRHRPRHDGTMMPFRHT